MKNMIVSRIESIRVICSECEQSVQSESEGFAGIAGGCIQPDNRYEEDAVGFFDVYWKVAPSLGGRMLNQAFFDEEEGKSGQFECYFCSMMCLRNFMNSRLDELERQVEEYTR